MEREGFLRSLQFLESAGLRVGAIVTDRHPSIQKYLREQRPEIQHYFDTWHVAKGLAKKIDALGKERSCGEVLAWRRSIINHLYWCASSSKTGEEAVEKWKSVTNHVQNVHHHNSDLFPVCAHPPLEMRAWLTPSTKACERFCDLMINQRLLKDVSKLSPHHQTSSVEGFHSLILKFAYNQSGEPSIKVKWPKYKKGDHSLHYTKTEPTYSKDKRIMLPYNKYGKYVDLLQN
ncbi:uncharacterized protein LOC127648343 [Xyrauchen texanus]|uniref:uncharacterized protein LOC127648343 n=1 Tax=Xyrauchen texanus TaxID=154827 RepID=UPI0022423154|nr:uncharacterized protein LOC127648343 [Xyrauchen texanus]XP_051988964.1 uncharacterized protein LOC127648343 [Xyrauchen texanus]